MSMRRMDSQRLLVHITKDSPTKDNMSVWLSVFHLYLASFHTSGRKVQLQIRPFICHLGFREKENTYTNIRIGEKDQYFSPLTACLLPLTYVLLISSMLFGYLQLLSLIFCLEVTSPAIVCSPSPIKIFLFLELSATGFICVSMTGSASGLMSKHCFLARGFWPNPWISLSLSFDICKMGIIVISFVQG